MFPKFTKHIINKETINPDLLLPMNLCKIIQKTNVIDIDKNNGKITSSNNNSCIFIWKKNIRGNNEKRNVWIGNLNILSSKLIIIKI